MQLHQFLIRGNMDQICDSLHSLLRQGFQLIPARTNRHDQWYKRRYQMWQTENGRGETDLLILTPKVPRTEWAPKLLTSTANISQYIEDGASTGLAHRDASDPPNKEKLFPDKVLDEPELMAPEYCQGHERAPLRPVMQRHSFWQSASLQEVAIATRALLECERFATLDFLSRELNAPIKDCLHITDKSNAAIDQGWSILVDDALHVLLFLGIISVFYEKLFLQNKYKGLLSFGALLSSRPPALRFMETLPEQESQHLHTKDTMESHMNRCLRILTQVQMLHVALGMEPVQWKARINNAMLYYIGFESWNRQREGQGYLGCALNTTKDDKWLRHGLGEEVEVDGGETLPVARKPADPLRLRSPKQNAEPGPDEDEIEELARLEALEKEEAVYGRKRSTKYQRRPRSLD